MHPDFRYQPIAEPEELGNAGRVKWVEGRSSQSPAVTGTDFILPGTVALPQFIFFSTSYPELDSAERRYEPGHAARCAQVRSLGAEASS